MIARLSCMHRFRSLEYSRCVCLWICKHEPPNNTGFPNSSGRFLGWRVDHLNVPGGVSISKDTLQVWVILKEESSNFQPTVWRFNWFYLTECVESCIYAARYLKTLGRTLEVFFPATPGNLNGVSLWHACVDDQMRKYTHESSDFSTGVLGFSVHFLSWYIPLTLLVGQLFIPPFCLFLACRHCAREDPRLCVCKHGMDGRKCA